MWTCVSIARDGRRYSVLGSPARAATVGSVAGTERKSAQADMTDCWVERPGRNDLTILFQLSAEDRKGSPCSLVGWRTVVPPMLVTGVGPVSDGMLAFGCIRCFCRVRRPFSDRFRRNPRDPRGCPSSSKARMYTYMQAMM
jgi:hypothetical protein